MKIQIANRLDQGAELQVPAQSTGRMEVLAHALAQIARLADVDDGSEAVAHQVNARFMRQEAELFANGLSHGHGGISRKSGTAQSLFGDWIYGLLDGWTIG